MMNAHCLICPFTLIWTFLLTSPQIYGLKTLVKSFLPHKDGHARQRIKGLLGVLTKLLQTGDISEDIKSRFDSLSSASDVISFLEY
jgi:hypothetical protein